jgi:hypothetical protein
MDPGSQTAPGDPWRTAHSVLGIIDPLEFYIKASIDAAFRQ